MDNTTRTHTSLWQKTKKIARFTWRHFFTIILLVMAVDFILEVTSVNYLNMLGTFAIAAFVDWFKCLKGKGSNNSHEQMLANLRTQSSTHVSNAMQSTLAWSSDPFAPGSPGYNIRQNRFNGY